MQYYFSKINMRQLFVDFICIVFLAIATCYIGNTNATTGGEGDNTSCNGVGNPNSPCTGTSTGGNGGNGGSGGNGGTSTSTVNNNQSLSAVGLGGNSTSVSDSTATGGIGYGVGGNSKSNAQGGNATGGQAKQDQKQGQDQAQHQSSDSQSNSAVNGSGNGGISNVAVTQEGNKVAAASANAVPVTVVQSDSCQTGFAAGGQAIAFGITFSGTKTDENCERIKLWRELRQAGYNKEALLLLMQDDRVAKAFNSGVQDKRVADAFANNKRTNNEYEGREVANLR